LLGLFQKKNKPGLGSMAAQSGRVILQFRPKAAARRTMKAASTPVFLGETISSAEFP
jgi:hypothetical protein